MNPIFFLVLRRMRAPLLVLIVAYAVALLGMVLVPGVDAEDRPWRMDFLHALYFVAYTMTTIGFGEIPYPFSPMQRLWATFSIFITVVAWFYALGNILALLQDNAFRAALTRLRFAHTVRRLGDPFYLICGHGDTGSALTRALVSRSVRVVVLDIDPARIDALRLENYPVYVPALCTDASPPAHLMDAGLRHPRCTGVVALTNVDAANLSIAIAGKLLNPGLKVICRGESQEAEASMRAFGPDFIVDPYDSFAAHLATALHAPYLHHLRYRLTGFAGDADSHPDPPRGTWVLCGFGRFGKAVYKRLRYEGVPVTIIEPDANAAAGEEGCIIGRGTDAVTLRAAHIERAVGIVAGTHDDATNLAILATARALNPRLFTVVRQNRRANTAIFQAVHADIVMQKGEVIADRIRLMLTMPLLTLFLRAIRHEREAWARDLSRRLDALVGGQPLRVWQLTLNESEAHAVAPALLLGTMVQLGDLLRDMRDRDRTLACLPLMAVRGEEKRVLPEPNWVLQHGDGLLFCGSDAACSRMQWTLQNPTVLRYVLSGETQPQGTLWQWLTGKV